MENPYEASPISPTPSEPNPANVYPLVSKRAVAFVLGMTIAGATLGAGLGLVIATLAPGYYQALFGAPVHAIQVGLGMGISQGAGCGFVGALALIAITYYLKLKRQHRPT